MKIQERMTQIKQIAVHETETNAFFLIPLENSNCYYGKNHSGNIVFVICPEITIIKKKYKLTTSDLLLEVNVESEFLVANKKSLFIAHILTCLSTEKINQIAFIRLCEAFKDSELTSAEDIIKLFNAFSNLFSSKVKSTFIELQGLYAELYIMRYFEKKGINLYQYWQSEDKRKHDFYVSNKKRIEVKSTSKDIRVHHFLHEQLLTEFHDIKIISIMTKKVDAGLSLYDLVTQVQLSPLASYNLLLHIEQKLKNCSEEEQLQFKFDEILLSKQLKIFDAKEIPHFKDKQPDGVFNAEYDSDLTGASSISINDFINWISD